MPVQTFNDLTVTGNWTQIASTYAPRDSPWSAVDIWVMNTDIVFIISEDPDSHTTQDTADQEVLCREGFSSRPMPPFYAIKFKVYEATALNLTGVIDVTLRTS